jgi:YD repeat-containing protein
MTRQAQGSATAWALISPDTGTASHSYDAAGNLATRTDSRGVLATYRYDPLNRLSGITYSQSGQTSQTFVSVSWRHLDREARYGFVGSRMTCAELPASSEAASITRLRNTGATFHWW